MESMKQVLIIEDDPDILELLQIHLKDLDCQADTALDGEAGLSNQFSRSF